MSAESVISVKNIKTYFYSENRCNRAVNGVSFEVKRGRTLCVVGESGCGKSVTASSIMQLLPRLARIEEGEIIYHSEEQGDIDLSKLQRNGKEMRQLRGKDIAMIFQDPMTALNPVFKVGNQIAENIRQHEKISKAEAKQRALELLTQMGIPEPEKRINQYPHEYSGGMRQRVMIAMAMSCNPKVLLADEPTTALDVTIQAQIFELMDKLKKEHNTAVVLITHDMGVVSEMADDILVMYMGNVIESGTAREVLKNPKHPYTKALLSAIPTVDIHHRKERIVVKGEIKSPINPGPGCRFATRCPYADASCHQSVTVSEVRPGHFVACSKVKEINNL